MVVWKDHDKVNLVSYDHKVKNSVYLTIIHMFNKQFQYPLVTVKEPTHIPASFQLDDGVDAFSFCQQITVNLTHHQRV